ncbi:hypothetical protein C8R46DRAFT_1356939 [Mycena filopes]|nr:hypothetical protein C8R46DRAFT_1356939 [Mycena filopes]
MPPTPHATPLRDKIAQFESKGAVPAPRAPFGASVPLGQQGGQQQKRELYGIRMDLKTVWVPSASAGPRGAQKEREREKEKAPGHTRGPSGGRSEHIAALPSPPQSLPSSPASTSTSESHRVSGQPAASSEHRDILEALGPLNNDRQQQPPSPPSSKHQQEEQSTPPHEEIPDIPEEEEVEEESGTGTYEFSIPFVESPISLDPPSPPPPPPAHQQTTHRPPSSSPPPLPPILPHLIRLQTAYAVKLDGRHNIEYGTISIAPPARLQSLPSPTASSPTTTTTRPRLGQTFTSLVHTRVRDPPRPPPRVAGKQRLPASPRPPHQRSRPAPRASTIARTSTRMSTMSMDAGLRALVANAAALERRLGAGEADADAGVGNGNSEEQVVVGGALAVVSKEALEAEPAGGKTKTVKQSRFHKLRSRSRKRKDDAVEETDAPPPMNAAALERRLVAGELAGGGSRGADPWAAQREAAELCAIVRVDVLPIPLPSLLPFAPTFVPTTPHTGRLCALRTRAAYPHSAVF